MCWSVLQFLHCGASVVQVRDVRWIQIVCTCTVSGFLDLYHWCICCIMSCTCTCTCIMSCFLNLILFSPPLPCLSLCSSSSYPSYSSSPSPFSSMSCHCLCSIHQVCSAIHNQKHWSADASVVVTEASCTLDVAIAILNCMQLLAHIHASNST